MEKQFTAVVTGASGFVGSHLVDLLLEKNFNVKCIVRTPRNLQWIRVKNGEIPSCELTDVDGLKRVFSGADSIFHVAGVVKAKNPPGDFDGNVKTTKAMLGAAEEYKDKIKRFLL